MVGRIECERCGWVGQGREMGGNGDNYNLTTNKKERENKKMGESFKNKIFCYIF